MAHNEQLAERIRAVVNDHPDVSSKKMFGGIAFMLNGNMCCGVVGDDLMVRVGADAYEDALSMRGARPMDFTGRPMKGMVYVDGDRLTSSDELASWIERGVDFAASLPAK